MNPFKKRSAGKQRRIVVFTSDQHFNSTRGLCPYRVTRHEGGTHETDKCQRWLWDRWIEFWRDEVAPLIGPEDTLHLVFVGDLVDGDHHNSHELISRNQITQHRIALKGLEPPLALNPTSVHIIKGTDVHAGELGAWEEYIAKDIDAVKDEEHNTYSWWWLREVFGGVMFDIAHHGKAGYREWTKPNAQNAQAVQTIVRYTERNENPPDVVIRADRHKYATSGDNYMVEATTLPPWQLQTSHGNRIDPDSILPVGGLIYVCRDGRYERKRKLYHPPPPQIGRTYE